MFLCWLVVNKSGYIGNVWHRRNNVVDNSISYYRQVTFTLPASFLYANNRNCHHNSQSKKGNCRSEFCSRYESSNNQSDLVGAGLPSPYSAERRFCFSLRYRIAASGSVDWRVPRVLASSMNILICTGSSLSKVSDFL